MGIVGRLEQKILVTKENERSLYWQYGDFDNRRFKPGDNVYCVTRFSNGNPYNTYSVCMNRDEIVCEIKSGDEIIGLKLDSAGRLIEDHKKSNPFDKTINRIQKIIINQASNGVFENRLEDDPAEYNEAQKLAAKIVGNDIWEIHGLINGIAQEMSADQKLFIGSVFCSDELDSSYISQKYEKIISCLASNYGDIQACQDFDPDNVESAMERAISGEEALEPWIEFGSFKYDDLVETSIILSQVGVVDGKSNYGEYGMWFNEPLYKCVVAIVNKAKEHDRLSYELKMLLKNIRVFRNCKFKARNPQETFKKYVISTLSANQTECIEDYIDLALAIQEIYYKNPENIHCDEEGAIIIDKAGIKIERKPYVLLVSRI